MANTTFTCHTCGREWPENYCPKCAHTIDRGPVPPIFTRIRRLRFKANKKLWILFSIPPFILCWLYPCVYDKGGSALLGRLWSDVLHGRRDFGLWVGLAVMLVIFGTFAALVGYAAQALVVVFRSRKKGRSNGAAYHGAAGKRGIRALSRIVRTLPPRCLSAVVRCTNHVA